MSKSGAKVAPIALRKESAKTKSGARAGPGASANAQPGSLYWDFIFRMATGGHSGQSGKLDDINDDLSQEAVVAALQRRDAGQILPDDVRGPMEQRFGWSFSGVRIHTGGAGGATEALSARAFTQGQDIYFAEGAFSPGDAEGRHLLAHELAHVVQGYQGRAPAARTGEAVSNPWDPLEREADLVASAVAQGSPSQIEEPRALAQAPVANPKVFRYVDPEGHTLPDPIELTIGGDPMRLEFRRIQKEGEPAFECAVKYLGPHPMSGPGLTGNMQRLSTAIGTAKLKSVVLKKTAESVDIDLFDDGTRVIRFLDEVRYDDRPLSKGREHQLSLKVNGKSVHLVSLWVLDPKASATGLQPSAPAESPGTNPTTFYHPSTNSWDLTIDGDGDQSKELLVRFVDRTPSAKLGTTAKKILVQITQRSTQTVRESEFELPRPAEASPSPMIAIGSLIPLVKQVTDGGSPTIVELTTTLDAAPQKLLINPPERTETGVQYKVQLSGKDVYYSFPPEKSPARPIFNAASAEATGGIIHADITLGAYNDRFRLTLQPRTATQAVLGLSPLYHGEPLGGDGIELAWNKPIVYSHKATGTGLALDLDNDGAADLVLFDRLTTPDSIDGGGPPESNRNHQVRIVGSAVGGEKSLYFKIRDGFPMRAGGSTASVVTTSNALAVGELKRQAAEGTFTQQLDAYESAMTAERQKAVTLGALDKTTFDAWLALSRSMIQLRAQKLPVDSELQDRAARQADVFYRAFAGATSGATTLSAASGWWITNNPYTGESRSPSGTTGAGPSLSGYIKSGRWGEAYGAYGALVTGLDRWIVDQLKSLKGKHAPEAERAELLAGRRRELSAMESKGAKRALATFQPDDKFKEEQGYVSQIPLMLYYWREGDTWYLKNITNPNKVYHVSVGAKQGETGPPRELLQKLDDPDRLPAGLIHYHLPGQLAGEVRTTDGLTWGKFFSYLSFGLAAIGLGLATFGTGAVAVAGAWVLAGSAVAGAVSAGIDLADKASHGDLDGTTALLDLAQIVAGLAGATALASSRITLAASNAPAGARWAGNWARLAVLANKVYIPATVTAATADVMCFAVISAETAKQLEEIESRPGDDPAAKSRAKFLLLSQLAVLGGLNALSIKGTVANLSRGRTLVLTPGPDGIPVATLALDKASVVIDTNAAIALDRKARGLPLDSGHQAALKRVEKFGADLRVADPTIAEMGVKGGNPTQKGVPISVERTSKQYQDILANLSDAADPVGQAKGAVDQQIVADTFFAVTEPGVIPTLATADKKIYNALSRRAGYDPNAKGAGIAVPVKFPDGFNVTIQGRTIKVIPIK